MEREDLRRQPLRERKLVLWCVSTLAIGSMPTCDSAARNPFSLSALLPLPTRVFGVQLHKRNRSLRIEKSLRVPPFCGFQLGA